MLARGSRDVKYQKWSDVKPHTEHLLEIAMAHAESINDVLAKPDRWKPPPTSSSALAKANVFSLCDTPFTRSTFTWTASSSLSWWRRYKSVCLTALGPQHCLHFEGPSPSTWVLVKTYKSIAQFRKMVRLPDGSVQLCPHAESQSSLDLFAQHFDYCKVVRDLLARMVAIVR